MRRQPNPVLTLALLCCICLCGLPAAAIAGPPFLTDDPEPVPFLHCETYVFSTVHRGAGTTFAQLPASNSTSARRPTCNSMSWCRPDTPIRTVRMASAMWNWA